MHSVVRDRAIVIVTHNMEQASRVSNRTALSSTRATWLSTARPTRSSSAPRTSA